MGVDKLREELRNPHAPLTWLTLSAHLDRRVHLRHLRSGHNKNLPARVSSEKAPRNPGLFRTSSKWKVVPATDTRGDDTARARDILNVYMDILKMLADLREEHDQIEQSESSSLGVWLVVEGSVAAGRRRGWLHGRRSQAASPASGEQKRIGWRKQRLATLPPTRLRVPLKYQRRP